MFENHENLLQTSEESDVQLLNEFSTKNLKSDSFCIHRINDFINTLITTVEYKPPHKLSVENLRSGLRSMNLWEEIVQSDTIPKSDTPNKDKKLRYNAEHLTCSVLVQEYHVMIQAGLEYFYITNGFAIILLRVPYDDPSTLYYYLCEPNMDVISQNPEVFCQSKTAIARILCLCLMSFLLNIRDQEWRNDARSQLHIWKTSFDFTRSQIPDEKLQQTPPGSEYASSEYMPSEHLSSSSLQPGHRVSTRSQATCAPMDTSPLSDHMDSFDFDSNQAAHGRKRGISQVMSSPPSQRSSARPAGPRPSSSQSQHTARYSQCSAVPVFLGTIDLKLFLFLHGAGDIRHMLLMGWAGESIDNVKDKEVLSREISRSKKEIRMLGVVHKDLRPVNMLWNDELRRVLIIDFHRSDIDRRPMKRQVGPLKRSLHQVDRSKQPCINSGWAGHSSMTESDVQSSA
ncbi:hypothetical protein AJ78_08304 [Emergomyces pasteurianus Ep9510]|uniref:Protein kinase domain-containing protein n=1 Tax=Emergomyces pasteurianus Ep9510 TaxID=1447872 RepID=A0A1J9P3Q5_9EURO|nr:hypothetical protein AJ78_08304 [Emergomyces pasteurianus Ep9510]